MPFSSDPATRELQFAVFDVLKAHMWGPVDSEHMYDCSCGARDYWSGRRAHEREWLFTFVKSREELAVARARGTQDPA